MRLDLWRYVIVQIAKICLRNLASIVFGKTFVDWHIVLGKADTNLGVIEVIKIENRPDCYYADPFLLTNGNATYIFAEEYSWPDSKGRISVIRVTDNEVEHLGAVIEERFHLSFPFIFQSGDDLFIIPESNADKTLRLYKCTSFPSTWEHHCDMLKDVEAADPIVMEDDEFIFVLCNCGSGYFGDRMSNLSIFRSSSSEGITSARLKLDSVASNSATNARNGGCFKYQENFYRVNQKPAFNLYGASISVNKVSIDQGVYSEERTDLFQAIVSFATKGSFGHHHFDFEESSGYFVCDIATLVFEKRFMKLLDFKTNSRMLLRLKQFLADV